MNQQIISWIENNIINYDKINYIVYQHPKGIISSKLVTIYNSSNDGEKLSVETFKYIVKTTKNSKNTFYNILNIVYDENTDISTPENSKEEINRLKKENILLKSLISKPT